VRDARLGGYIGLASTFGMFWALLSLISFHGAPWTWILMAFMLLVRGAVALVVGKKILADEQVTPALWLLPLRDLIAVGIWLVSFVGHTVTWRGDIFELKNGRLIRVAHPD
jgi:ceramide glucosyltransferase